ncbi:MAG: sulfatase-like hydrolase/transferase, partial [Planctomycetes bacterium]|nr:sulfatase-like hydrolase/transferase [Planctomycetota bacterium]
MDRRKFLKTVGCVAVAGAFGSNGQLSAVSAKKNKQPNIVLICADDMGFGDVGYHGFKDILTPNIDRIATEGVQFTQGYVSASVCGPSRAGLLTGVYQQRFGCGENPSSTGWPDNVKFPMAGLPRSQPMMAEMLKEQGYTCGMVGKW